MTFRKMSCTLACLAGLAAVSSGPLAAQEPAQDAVKVLPSNSLEGADPASVTSEVDFLVDSNAINMLNLVAATHGNLLGVEVGDVDAALRTQLGIEGGVGVVVTSVNKDSDAAKSGLEAYDLVLRIGDQKIAGTKQFHDLVSSQQEKTVEFHVIHKGKPATVTVTIPKRLLYEIVDPNVAARHAIRYWLTDAADGQRNLLTRRAGRLLAAATDDRGPRVEQHYRIGVNLAEADNTLRSQLRLAAGEGLVVTDVLDDSAAAKAGIQKNDVWIKLAGKRLTSVEAVNAQVQEIKDRQVTVTLYRGGSEISVEVTPRLVSEPTTAFRVATELDQVLRDLNADHFAEHFALRVRMEPIPVNFEEVIRRARVESPTQPTPAEQLALVKKQLADLQKSVEALEAALQAAPVEKPTPPDDKK